MSTFQNDKVVLHKKTCIWLCDYFCYVNCKRPAFAQQKNSSNAKGFLWITKWQRHKRTPHILSERLNWNKIKCLTKCSVAKWKMLFVKCNLDSLLLNLFKLHLFLASVLLLNNVITSRLLHYWNPSLKLYLRDVIDALATS